MPLLGSKAALGVLKVHPNTKSLFTPEQMTLLESCAEQIALALEADKLSQRKKQIEVQTEIDRVRNALLQYLSQDLRAPLASLFVCIGSIRSLERQLTPSEVNYFLNHISVQAQELERIINTLCELLVSKSV